MPRNLNVAPPARGGENCSPHNAPNIAAQSAPLARTIIRPAGPTALLTAAMVSVSFKTITCLGENRRRTVEQ
jgi:hypothetical protein